MFWRKVPVDDAYHAWLTVGFERRLLVVVRTITALTRLLDILSLVERDHRIQVVFTCDEENPAIFHAGVPQVLDRLGAAVVPWALAAKTRFDLVLAASENDALHELDGPVVLVPHGIGFQKYYPGGEITSGMNPSRLLRDGEVVPAALALSHGIQREQLRFAAPAVLERAVVVGDPCHDRMLASVHRAAHYRAALGTGRRTLVALASTWGRHSLFGTTPELPGLLVNALPVDEYQVAVILHPGVWAAHGPWQIRAWLGEAIGRGLALIAPERGWQATLVAADCVLSDEGSAALYAAAVDKPLLLAAGKSRTTVAGSPLAALAGQAHRLDPGGDLRAQIESIRDSHRAGSHQAVVAQAIEHEGGSADRLTGLLYRFLDLTEPEDPAFPPVHAPVVPEARLASFVASVDFDGAVAVVERFPHTSATLPMRHVVAHAEQAELRELDGAAVVWSEMDGSDPAALLAGWPAARLAAATDDTRCAVLLREGDSYELTAPGVAPIALASLAYALVTRREPVAGRHRLRIGGRVFDVTSTRRG
ncbi:hypothetical protein [Amycolatopsis minnesotensis]|uniref:Uncharacterized protein n=1 Tax=Amycolatopsis minnesotensis TaxID=337894 RepID=A0ABN2QJD7_9PSEU